MPSTESFVVADGKTLLFIDKTKMIRDLRNHNTMGWLKKGVMIDLPQLRWSALYPVYYKVRALYQTDTWDWAGIEREPQQVASEVKGHEHKGRQLMIDGCHKGGPVYDVMRIEDMHEMIKTNDWRSEKTKLGSRGRNLYYCCDDIGNIKYRDCNRD